MTKAIITEVSPRDGLQDEKKFVPTEVKLKFIQLLADAGLPIIEVTSFVSAKRIPALADHALLMQQLPKNAHARYSVLIPNLKGLQEALPYHCDYISVITAISETFAQKNMHCSIADSIERIREILAITKPKKIFVRAYISCALGCPDEGAMDAQKTALLAKQLLEMGCDEIALGDTIGAGTPALTQQLIQAVSAFMPVEKIAIHFHDARGQALANIKICVQMGVYKIDSAVGGLGGCPYAKGASGNVATEKVIALLDTLRIEHGVDLEKLKKADMLIQQFI